MWLLVECAGAAAFWVPAALLVHALLGPAREPFAWAALSGALAYALSIVVGACVLYLRLGQAGVAALLGVLSLVALLACRRAPRPRLSAGLPLVLAAGLLPRVFFQLRRGDFPNGWDPNFHLAVVRAAELQHGIPWTLAPFEDAPVNYPWGTHLSILAEATLSGGAPHQAFSAQNSVVCGAISIAAVAWLAQRCFGDRRASLAAALLYACVAHYGSADYFNWGGLPNHAGMALFVTAFAALLGASTRERALGVVLLGASFVAHHHVMITALWVTAAWALLRAAFGGGRPALARGAVDIGLALLVALPITLPLVLRVGTIGKTGVLTYYEGYSWVSLWKDALGAPLLVLAVCGLGLVSRRDEPHKLAPVAFAAALLLAFGVASGLYRAASVVLVGAEREVLTPSRFVTDLAYPAAILGGLFVAHAWARARLATALLAPLLLGEQWLWMQSRRSSEPHPDVEAYAELRRSLEDDAVVFANVALPGQCPYLLGLECTRTVRPTSEMETDRTRAKLAFDAALRKGQLDPVERRRLFGDRPLWLVSDRPTPPELGPSLDVGSLHAVRLPTGPGDASASRGER